MFNPSFILWYDAVDDYFGKGLYDGVSNFVNLNGWYPVFCFINIINFMKSSYQFQIKHLSYVINLKFMLLKPKHFLLSHK